MVSGLMKRANELRSVIALAEKKDKSDLDDLVLYAACKMANAINREGMDEQTLYLYEQLGYLEASKLLGAK